MGLCYLDSPSLNVALRAVGFTFLAFFYALPGVTHLASLWLCSFEFLVPRARRRASVWTTGILPLEYPLKLAYLQLPADFGFDVGRIWV